MSNRERDLGALSDVAPMSRFQRHQLSKVIVRGH